MTVTPWSLKDSLVNNKNASGSSLIESCLLWTDPVLCQTLTVSLVWEAWDSVPRRLLRQFSAGCAGMFLSRMSLLRVMGSETLPCSFTEVSLTRFLGHENGHPQQLDRPGHTHRGPSRPLRKGVRDPSQPRPQAFPSGNRC